MPLQTRKTADHPSNAGQNRFLLTAVTHTISNGFYSTVHIFFSPLGHNNIYTINIICMRSKNINKMEKHYKSSIIIILHTLHIILSYFTREYLFKKTNFSILLNYAIYIITMQIINRSMKITKYKLTAIQTYFSFQRFSSCSFFENSFLSPHFFVM